jgi:hypothetical protein
MDKKQLLLLSAISALVISGFGAVRVFAADSTDISKRIEDIQNRFGITLTDGSNGFSNMEAATDRQD